MYKFFLFILIPAFFILVLFKLLTEAPVPAPPVSHKTDEGEVLNFAECALRAGTVMESYPRRCNWDGKTFVEDIGNELEKMDLIRISQPRPNDKVGIPLIITGEARGTWFFEASFPVRLIDDHGREIAAAPAQAKGEWMTSEFVPFEARLEFKTPDAERGFLLLEKSNPSGLPEHADALRVPVTFR